MRWGLVFVASCSLLTGVGASAPAMADALDDRIVCEADDRVGDDKRLAACTAFIQAPPKSNEVLYQDLDIRAGVWCRKRDFDRSMQD